MPTISLSHLSTVVVYLFAEDYDLQPFSLDVVAALGYTKYSTDNGRIQFSDPENQRVVRIQPRRIEFEFAKVDALDPATVSAAVTKFLDKLGNKKFAAFGTNYMSQVVKESIGDAGEFIKTAFLKNEAELEAALGRKIMAASTRFFAGDINDYIDIRLSLADIGKPAFIYNLHMHKAVANPGDYNYADELIARLDADKILLPELFEKVTK